MRERRKRRTEVKMAEKKVIVTTDPPKHWCRKMRAHWKNNVGPDKCYITEEEVMERARATLEAYPELDAKEIMDHARHSWVHDLNCGMQIPPGYRLTREQFVQNMWVMVNQPSFRQRASEMTAKVMQHLDKEKKGYVTRDQYLRMSKKRLKEDDVEKIFDALDETKSGKITCEAMEKAHIFFFTDTTDEGHPFNLLTGPLVD